jgi:hypothetical protein
MRVEIINGDGTWGEGNRVSSLCHMAPDAVPFTRSLQWTKSATSCASQSTGM